MAGKHFNFDCVSGIETEIELSEAELAQMAKRRLEGEAEAIKIVERNIAKAALLQKLGITEEEAKLLLS